MKKHNTGFSLIELIIVIVISGIIAGSIALFIVRPMEGFTHITRRVALADTADKALARLKRDVRRALPNSVRIKTSGSITALEFINTVDALRYRTGPDGVDDNSNLSFSVADDNFNMLGTFQKLTLGAQPADYRLVIYNTGMYGTDPDDPNVGSNVYAGAHPGPIPPANSHIITPSSTTLTLSNIGSEAHFALSAPFLFYLESPQQRLYVVDTPITYLCDTTASVNTLTRYSGYAIGSTQPTDAASAPLSSASSGLLAKNVESCTFTYTSGTTERNAVLTMEIVLNDTNERVRILHQVHVVNTP